MKRIGVIFVAIALVCISSLAYDGVYNGILVIGSNDKDFGVKTTDGISGVLNYNIELYTDGIDKQYCLRMVFKESKRLLMIPTHGSILLKTKADDIIELNALYSYDDVEGYCYFPISEEQLDKITTDGVVKFRIQVIAETDHHRSIGEIEWKNETLGSSIKSMVEDVDKQWEKKKKSFSASQGDIRSGF